MARIDTRVWPATARRDSSGTLVVGGLVCPGADRAARLARCSSSTRPTSARAPRPSRRPTRIRGPGVGVLRRQGVPVRHNRALAGRRGHRSGRLQRGELALALAAGFPAERITLHGNNKSDAEIEAALAAGVGRIVIDALDEVQRVADLAGRAGTVARVLVRVTTGVEAHTHEFIATAHEDQKFGLSLTSGAAREAVLAVLARPELEFVGVHSHIGSQIFSTSGFEVAAHRVIGLIGDLAEHDGVAVEELNLGGGMGIAYLSGDDPVAPVAMAEALRSIVAGESARRGIPVPRIAVEPGRAIVGPSMITLYTVGTVKPVEYRTGRYPHVRLGRRRHERQHPDRALRGGVHGDAGEPGVQRTADALARRRQALRVRGRRRARRLAARRPGPR